jgi:hypothetical protein
MLNSSHGVSCRDYSDLEVCLRGLDGTIIKFRKPIWRFQALSVGNGQFLDHRDVEEGVPLFELRDAFTCLHLARRDV